MPSIRSWTSVAVAQVALDERDREPAHRRVEVRHPPSDEVVDDDDLGRFQIDETVGDRRADHARSTRDENVACPGSPVTLQRDGRTVVGEALCRGLEDLEHAETGVAVGEGGAVLADRARELSHDTA